MTVALRRSLYRLLIGFLTLALCVLSHPVIAQLPSPTEQFQQGQQAYLSGQYTQAADLWQAAATSYADAEDRLHQAMALSNLGLAYLKLGRFVEAETAIATAQDRIQALVETPEQQRVAAQVLSAQAQAQQSRGQYVEAIQTLTEAQANYAAVEDAAGELRSQLNQAQIFQLQGRYLQALNLLNQVTEQLATLPDSALKANGLRQLGDTLRLVENAERAQAVLEESFAVAQTIDDPSEQAATLISLGNTAEAQQQPDTALQYYDAAAVLSPDLLVALQAQINSLRLLKSENQFSRGQSQVADILTAIEALPPGRNSLFTQINLVDLLISQDTFTDDRTVADLLVKILHQAAALQDTRSQAYALGYLGKLYQQNQQLVEATDLTRQALSLSQRINADSVTYRWQWQLGQLLAAQGEPDAAIEAYQQTLGTLEALRSDLAAVNPEVRFSFRDGIEPIYRELADLLLKSDSDGRSPSQDNLRQARDVVEALQVAELVNFFRADCVVTTPVEIDQVDANALVINPIILPDRLELLVSAPGRPLQDTTVAVTADQLNVTLDNLQQAISLPTAINRAGTARAGLTVQRTGDSLDHLPLAQQVYDWLIRPIEPQIQAVNPDVLVFVLDGALRNVPMAVLHDGEQYLIEKHAIALTPGLQLLEPPQPLAENQLQALVAGLSEARDEFSALPNVEREVTAIQTQVSGAVLLNEGFSKESFTSQLKDSSFPIVHLATHGQFSSDPEQTFILAWDDRIRATELGVLLQQGELTREAAVELLVLSACETASGDARAALGLAGIAVRSGARSTLATLWLVDDRGTSVLMENLYRQLSNTSQTKAEVLRQAQLQLLRDENYQHPYFWAPFVLLGNWL